MYQMKRWIVMILIVCLLSSGLSGTAAAQDRDAELAEGLRLYDQVLTLRRAGRYDEAIPLAKRALAIAEKVLGAEHSDVALLLNCLADLYKAKGDYARAEPLYRRALAIRKKVSATEPPLTATGQGREAQLAEAERLIVRAETLFNAGAYNEAIHL